MLLLPVCGKGKGLERSVTLAAALKQRVAAVLP